MFYNTKYRLWSKVANWWEKFKPICSHWFKTVSSRTDGRREIEVSKCYWCNELTSELYIKGEKFEDHFDHIPGYGPVEACPVTEEPEPSVPWTGPVITLPNKELYRELNSSLAPTNRDSRKSPKAKSKSRRTR